MSPAEECVVGDALVMAGGGGERMRASGVACPKPLAPVRGVPLLEWNVHALLRARVPRITVAVPAPVPEIAAFVRDRLVPLAAAAGALLECFVEEEPLGNIGCAGLVGRGCDNLLVVYADNLTVLDLGAIARFHCEQGADMTIATHRQPFAMPFGEVRIRDGAVTSYVEKPVVEFDICSAISVLGPAAIAALPPDKPTGLSQLVQSLIAHDRQVRAYRHEDAWIDVNSAQSLAEAEALVLAHPEGFALWNAGS